MDQNLKQRLVGASVIVALAVIFVPMLFDGKPVQGDHQVELRIPDKPNLPPLEKRRFDIDQPVGSQTPEAPPVSGRGGVPMEAAIEPEPVKAVVAAEKTHHQVIAEKQQSNRKPVVAQVEPAQEKAASSQPEAKKKEQPKKPEPAANATDSATVYRAKIGSFSQRANAEKVRGKLLLAKIPTAIARDDSRSLFHVYSPPFASQAEARRYVEQVVRASRSSALGLGRPVIVSLNLQESDQITRQTAKAWVVQVGSFSQLANARKLRDKLRAQGYTAFVDQASAAGKKLYRVRVGPEVDRDEAGKIQNRLRQKLQIRGVVRPHELSEVVD